MTTSKLQCTLTLAIFVLGSVLLSSCGTNIGQRESPREIRGTVENYTGPEAQLVARIYIEGRDTGEIAGDGLITTDGTFEFSYVEVIDDSLLTVIDTADLLEECPNLEVQPQRFRSQSFGGSTYNAIKLEDSSGNVLGSLMKASSDIAADGGVGVTTGRIFVNQDVRYVGACSDEIYDLELTRGWNLVSAQNRTSGSGGITVTNGNDPTTSWRFVP